MKELNYKNVQIGDVVYVLLYGIFRHYGVVVREAGFNSEPIIRTILRSEATPVDQIISEFAGEKLVTMITYPSETPRWVAAQNALNVKSFKYDLLSNNCEHFYRRIHGLSDVSSQVIITTVIAGIGLALVSKKVRFPA